MSKKRYIDTRFWSDTWVMDGLSKHERLLFLYLLTNDKTNVAGVYEISLKTIMLETDFTKDELIQMLTKIRSRVIYTEGWIVLRKAVKHQNYQNPKIEQGIINALSKCPQELLAFIDLPKDAKVIKDYISKHLTSENRLPLDILSIGLDELSHLDSDIDIDSDIDLDLDAGLKNQQGRKRLTGPAAASYAKAVKLDGALAKKEAGIKQRKPGSGLESAREIAAKIKLRHKAISP